MAGYFGDKTTGEIWDIYELLATNRQQKAIYGRRSEVNVGSSSDD